MEFALAMCVAALVAGIVIVAAPFLSGENAGKSDAIVVCTLIVFSVICVGTVLLAAQPSIGTILF